MGFVALADARPARAPHRRAALLLVMAAGFVALIGVGCTSTPAPPEPKACSKDTLYCRLVNARDDGQFPLSASDYELADLSTDALEAVEFLKQTNPTTAEWLKRLEELDAHSVRATGLHWSDVLALPTESGAK